MMRMAMVTPLLFRQRPLLVSLLLLAFCGCIHPGGAVVAAAAPQDTTSSTDLRCYPDSTTDPVVMARCNGSETNCFEALSLCASETTCLKDGCQCVWDYGTSDDEVSTSVQCLKATTSSTASVTLPSYVHEDKSRRLQAVVGGSTCNADGICCVGAGCGGGDSENNPVPLTFAPDTTDAPLTSPPTDSPTSPPTVAIDSAFDPALATFVDWPGIIPTASNALTLNIQYDDYPQEITWKLEYFVNDTTTSTTTATTTSNSRDGKNQDYDDWTTIDYFFGPIYDGPVGLLQDYPYTDLEDGRYRLTMEDSYGDGLTNGWISITAAPTVNHTEGIVWSVLGETIGSGTTVFLQVTSDTGDVLLEEEPAPPPIEIPPTIFAFGQTWPTATTTNVDLQSDSLTGTIPTDIWFLTALTHLDLGFNDLTGTLPTQLGLLTLLEELHFYDSFLTGTVPTQLGRLTELLWLNGWGNSLTGLFPTEIGQLTQLTDINFRRNYQLSGTLPIELMTQLEFLYMDDNLFTSTIPTQIGLMTNMERIEIDNNFMTGTVPTEIGNLQQMTNLQLDSNYFTGTIPSQIGLMTSLTLLELDTNSFTGALPEEICDLPFLSTCDVDSFEVDVPTVCSAGCT